jgi:hypothetical protein
LSPAKERPVANNWIKKFRTSKKAQMIFIIAGLFFSIWFLLWQIGGSIGSLIPSGSRLEKLSAEQQKAAAEVAELEKRMKEVDTAARIYHESLGGFWNDAVNGNADVELRKKIEEAAQKAGLKLNSIGTVRRSRINNDLQFLEIDMGGVETLEILTNFYEEIYKARPQLYWKRVDLRQEHLQNSERLVFNGTLRLIAIEPVGK